MKIRTVKYIIKEGLVNSYRNKLMSLASIGIMSASLIIFGLFLLISINMNHAIGQLKQQPEIEVFCKPEIDDTMVAGIEKKIKEDPRVRESRMVSKKEALEQAKALLGDNKYALDGEDESFLPVKFIVKLTNLEDSKAFADKFKEVGGISKVRYSQDEIDFISGISRWISLASSGILMILLVISIFIISNTIKLTVFARRKEINIMKYVGATDWFIRWPFILEGVVIGLIGSIVAIGLLTYGYSVLETRISSEFIKIGNETLSIVHIKEFSLQVSALFCGIGILVGALGSLISIRKHLHV